MHTIVLTLEARVMFDIHDVALDEAAFYDKRGDDEMADGYRTLAAETHNSCANDYLSTLLYYAKEMQTGLDDADGTEHPDLARAIQWLEMNHRISPEKDN